MKHIFYILIFLCATSVGFGQKASVKLTVDFDDVEVGDPIVVTVTCNIQGDLEINFPDEFVTGSGMQSMKQEMDHNTGKVKTMYFFAQHGAFTKLGKYSFKATISNNGHTYKSNSVTVKVAKQAQANEIISKRNLKRPAFGVIEKSKARIYEGEPLLVNGKVYTKLKVAVQGYHPFELVGNAEIVKLNPSNDLVFSSEIVNGQKFSAAQFGKQLMFFTAPGKYQINPFEMALLYEIEENYGETLVFSSGGNSVEVVPLPNGAPNDFIGAVGKYNFSRSLDKTDVKQGDVVTMTVTVSGYGNLHNINTPELKLPKGVVIYGDPEIEEKIHFGLRGAEGEMIYKFNLQVVQAGDFLLPEMSISYFDPIQKKYITIREKSQQISGEKANDFQTQLPQAITKVNDEKSGLAAIVSNDSDDDGDYFLNSGLFWTSVVSPVALAFLGGLFFVRRKKDSENIGKKRHVKEKTASIHHLLKTAESHADTGDFKQGFSMIEQALKLTASIILDKETGLTKMEIQEGFQELGLDPEMINEFVKLLLRCEEARYAFMDQPELFKQTLMEASLITQKIF